tara:strand:- start:1320 stop:1682 length:363 start_codon:yes stop_codon:yes gene_type:complete
MNSLLDESTTQSEAKIKHASTPSDYNKCESDSIIKFTYFANNFNHNFIQEVWGTNSLGQHLKDKWDMLGHEQMAFKTATQHVKEGNYYGQRLSGTDNFYKFYMMLDSYNKEVLNNYISNK